MAPLVYLETSIVSYLTAWPSRDLIVAGRQQLTHEWWSRRRSSFEVVVSSAAAEMLALALLKGAALPAQARADALHIAIAATQGVSYLLTWKSAHIANAEKRPLVEAVCRLAGYEAPILCTPDELMGEDSNVDASR